MRFWLSVAALLLLTGCSAQNKPHSEFNFRYRLAEESPAAAPVIVLLHGYGSDENDLFSLAPRLPFRMHVFSLRAPITLPQGGFAWYVLGNRIGDRWQYDYKEAVKARNTIKSFIHEICASFHVDSNKVFLLGFSQGAIMSYDMALNEPALIKGIAALSGGIMPESKRQNASSSGVNYFIGHGKQDEVIPFSWSASAADYLKQQGAAVTFKEYEASHQIPEAELRDLDLWFKQQTH